MSMFKTEDCPICGQSTGALKKSSFKYNGLYICNECLPKILDSGLSPFDIKKKEVSELLDIVNKAKQKEEEFSVFGNSYNNEIIKFDNGSKRIGNSFYLDKEKDIIGIAKRNKIGKVIAVDYIPFEKIVEFELLEDGNTISDGGIGRAFVGNILAGGVGAIVGSSTGKTSKTCTTMRIKLTVNDMSDPTVFIDLITSEVKKKDKYYKESVEAAQEILSTLNLICQNNQAPVNQDSPREGISSSAVEELLNYKKLLDAGIISQEEFDQKKKEIL